MTDANDMFLMYSQKGGFTACGLDADVEWKEGEEHNAWRRRLGYTDGLWALGDDAGVCATAYRTHNAALPRFMVDVCDVLGTAAIVFVSDVADLFAFRLRVAPLVIADQGDAGLEFIREQQKALADG